MTATTGARVLVLEDEWMIAQQLVTALVSGGFVVVGPVARIEEAMSLLEDAAVDAAVLDINLQGERSYLVAEFLARSSTPFVFVSGYSDAELPPRYRDQPLLTKPVDDARLLKCMDVLLATPGKPRSGTRISG